MLVPSKPLGVLLSSSLETVGHPEPLYDINAVLCVSSSTEWPLIEGHHIVPIFPENSIRREEECDCWIHYIILESNFWSVFGNSSLSWM